MDLVMEIQDAKDRILTLETAVSGLQARVNALIARGGEVHPEELPSSDPSPSVQPETASPAR